MNKNLSQNPNLKEFFQEKIKDALKRQSLNVSAETEFYLVHILAHFSKSENLFNKDHNGKVEYKPLALKLYDATFSPARAERFQHLKSLGDTALYHAGVFYEGLYNNVVDVDYYISMGGSAYNTLANLSTSNAKILADMFMELSEQFAKLVEVLHLCCESETVISDHDLLKMLDRYAKTGSEKAKEILKEKGIVADNIFNVKTVQ